MALSRTTLTSAVTASDLQMVVASATGFAVGNFVLFGQEVSRVSKSYISGTTILLDGRGLEGTLVPTVNHPATEGVVTGLPSDFAKPGPQATLWYPIFGKVNILSSYSAAGAIALPLSGQDATAVINGTVALAMTLANPTTDMDGSMLTVAGNGKAAHTVTYAAGFGNVGATADVMTFGATQAQAFQCIALNGFWNLVGPLAVATANVSGPSLA